MSICPLDPFLGLPCDHSIHFVDFVTVPYNVVKMKLSGDLSGSTFKSVCGCRLVDRETVVTSVYTGEDMGGGAAICEWLRVIGARQHKISEKETQILNFSPPQFCSPGQGIGAYIDIKSAYHSLYTRLNWLDEAWLGRRGMTKGLDLSSFPTPYTKNKIVRSAVLSVMRGGHTSTYLEGVLVKRTQKKAYQNLHILAIVMEGLNLLAKMAVSCGFVYWNTDGGIGDLGAVNDFLDQAKELFPFLEFREKAMGDFFVKSVGAYKIGPVATAQFSRLGTRASKKVICTLPKEKVIFLLRG